MEGMAQNFLLVELTELDLRMLRKGTPLVATSKHLTIRIQHVSPPSNKKD